MFRGISKGFVFVLLLGHLLDCLNKHSLQMWYYGLTGYQFLYIRYFLSFRLLLNLKCPVQISPLPGSLLRLDSGLFPAGHLPSSTALVCALKKKSVYLSITVLVSPNQLFEMGFKATVNWVISPTHWDLSHLGLNIWKTVFSAVGDIYIQRRIGKCSWGRSIWGAIWVIRGVVAKKSGGELGCGCVLGWGLN